MDVGDVREGRKPVFEPQVRHSRTLGHLGVLDPVELSVDEKLEVGIVKGLFGDGVKISLQTAQLEVYLCLKDDRIEGQ